MRARQVATECLRLVLVQLVSVHQWSDERGDVVAEGPPAVRMRAYVRMQEQLFEVKEPVSVLGRSKRCDIVLPDPNVSRQHAEIRLEGDGHVLVDLDSTNGVKINGREVKRAVLADGDRIELGSTELRFERRP